MGDTRLLEIKVKHSKGDQLFVLKKGVEREPDCLIPVNINSVSCVKFLAGEDFNTITYSANTVDKNISVEVNEVDLYSAEEIERFLK